MTKKITIFSAVLLASTISFAGPIKGSLQASSKASTGATNISGTSLKIVVNSASDAALFSVDKLSDALTLMKDASIAVIENPVGASSASVKSVATSAKKSAQFVITKTGMVLKMSANGIVAFVKDPSAQISKVVKTSGKAIKVTVDATGRLLTASGAYLKDNFGNDVSLVLTASGDVYKLSANSTVMVFRDVSGAAVSAAKASYATAVKVGKGSVRVTKMSVNKAQQILLASTQDSAKSSGKLTE